MKQLLFMCLVLWGALGFSQSSEWRLGYLGQNAIYPGMQVGWQGPAISSDSSFARNLKPIVEVGYFSWPNHVRSALISAGVVYPVYTKSRKHRWGFSLDLSYLRDWEQSSVAIDLATGLKTPEYTGYGYILPKVGAEYMRNEFDRICWYLGIDYGVAFHADNEYAGRLFLQGGVCFRMTKENNDE